MELNDTESCITEASMLNVYKDAQLVRDLAAEHRRALVTNARDAISLIREGGLLQCLMTCGVPSRLVGSLEDIENFLFVNFPEIFDDEDEEYEGEGVESEDNEEDEE